MERKVPQNNEAEMAVLGAVFLSTSSLDKVSEELTRDMFYLKSHQLIFDTILSLRENNIPIDIKTVTDELDKKKNLTSIGGVDYLIEIVDSVGVAANLEYYINIVKEKAVLRSLIDNATSIVTSAYESTDSLNDILDEADRKISNVIKNRKTSEFLPISKVIRSTQENIERLAKNKSNITGLATNFYRLDEITGGLQPNTLTIIAARPAMGKTAIGLNLATNAALNSSATVAIFSMEMGAEQLAIRMISSIGGVDSRKIERGILENADWKRVNEAMSQLADSKIFIEDASGMTVSEIKAKCRRLANSDTGLDLVVIDYLQLIQGSSRYAGNRQQEVSEISRSLKMMAMELHIPVVALAQLSRSVELRESKKPTLSDLRESGSIEQDADIVSFLYREDYYQKNYDPKNTNYISEAELIIGKNRNGVTGTINLIFEMNYSNFKNALRTEE
jgi:replicative DNA helicase